MKTVISDTAEATQDLGRRIGDRIRQSGQGFAMALTGDLGAGKTCFVQGLAQGLGVDEGYYITSPTFNIINAYPAGRLRLLHLDLYRLSEAEELDYLGIEELVDQQAVLAVEWPEFLQETGFDFNLKLAFEFDEEFNRVISLFPYGQRALNLLSNVFS